MKMFHRGRLVDSAQVPRRNRSRYLLQFWFKCKAENPQGFIWGWTGTEIVVYDNNREKELKAYRDKWLEANLGVRHKILRCTAKFLGGDI